MARGQWGMWSRLLPAVVAAILMAAVAQPAAAAYWTVPIDYYKLEHIRFALSQDKYGQGVVLNLAQRLQDGRLDGQSKNLAAYVDQDRGYAADFSATSGSRIIYRAPMVSEAGNRDAASLSFWLRPKGNADSTMVLSGGTDDAGYSLYFYEDRLRFVIWSKGGANAGTYQIIDSRSKVRPGVWHNVVLSQSAAAAPSGAYVALYIDGVLEGVSKVSPDGSGLLGRDTAPASRAVIGGASETGWIYERVGERFRYQRDQDGPGKIDRIGAFTNAEMSEFRYFGGIQFVCSDKTRADYRDRNTSMGVGERCDIASDVASYAHDRLEQAGFLARLPYALELSDHNFEGLNAANVASDCSTCSRPRFTQDELRQSVAAFDANRVQYRTGVGALSISNWNWPYSVAFWLEAPKADHGFQPIFTAGGVRTSGFDIALGREQRLEVTVWAFAGAYQPSVQSDRLTPGWHHVVVTFDGPDWSEASRTAPSGLKLFIDGQVQVSDGLYGIRRPAIELPITIGGPDHHNGTFDQRDTTYYEPTFRGRLSEIQVVGMPITFAQARALASRFPNAYTPSFTKQDYPFVWKDAEGVKTQPGYAYRNPVATTENGHADPKDIYDSLNLAFDVDWSKPAPRWLDEASGEVSRNCEYVLGGLRYYHELKDAAVSEPSSVFLCFSPQKIDHNMPPFSLAMYYPFYEKFLFLTVVEPMATRSVLKKLKTYSSAHGVDGLKTHFELNVGRYNMVVQARTADASASPSPNYVSPAYQGASALISKAFQYSGQGPRPEQQVTAVHPASAVTGIQLDYVDQKQLLNDLDMKFSKDR